MSRVLLITPRSFEKPMDGGAIRVRAIYEALTQQPNTAVDVVYTERRSRGASYCPRDFLARLRVLSSVIRYCSRAVLEQYSGEAVDEISSLLSTNHYDAFVVEYSHLYIYRKLLKTRVVFDLHNVESALKANLAVSIGRKSPRALVRRIVALLDSMALRRIERSIVSREETVATVSDHDRQLMLSFARSSDKTAQVVVAPNGVSDLAFELDPPRRDTVVFVAHLGWRPNVDAAMWLVREVWPLVQEQAPHLTLELIGRSPRPEVRALDGSSITVHADVPDVLPFVARARVATAPLLAAGGTRLKILEALGSGTPVVATPMGALGLESLVGRGLSIVQRPVEFASAIVELATGEVPDRSALRSGVQAYRWDQSLQPLLSAVFVKTLRRTASDER